ncbi:MAG: glutamate-5-semialdehyde dehydrogenase [Erysipelotrichaceae bacterium]|nr:glutamate-5-semialdehyde dehydrogenase [Erysipelotrichaceae bacterium]
MKKLIESAAAAKDASRITAVLPTARKNLALHAIADSLISNAADIIASNQLDLLTAQAAGMSPSLIDRLMLNQTRIEEMAVGVRQIAALSDPIDEIIEEWTTADELNIKKIRVPLGVIGIIYEARPNVTVDAAALAFKAGNSILLRGSSSAYNSNMALVNTMRSALAACGITADAICFVEDPSHDTVDQMLKLRDGIDLIIPRGGASLISHAIQNATVPILETGIGNCHVYIDETADYQMAESIVINAKTQRTGVCNALETLLVNEQWAVKNLRSLLAVLIAHQVELHADQASGAYCSTFIPAQEADWTDEYLRLALAVKIVPDVTAAVSHIQRYGTKHTECIITADQANALYFQKQVDAAVVNVNASTRFTDGFMFGFGAELGISTQKLHARGPMGLKEITSYKYLVTGNGQVRK